MLEIIVSIEWLVLGIVLFCGMRSWNRRFTQLYNELTAEDDEE